MPRKPRQHPRQLALIAPGSLVTLAGGQDAGVLRVEIGMGDYIRYEVMWWANGERKTQWLEAFEVALAGEQEPAVIGFQQVPA